MTNYQHPVYLNGVVNKKTKKPTHDYGAFALNLVLPQSPTSQVAVCDIEFTLLELDSRKLLETAAAA